MTSQIKRQVDKTTSLIVGTVGLSVAGAAGSGLTGTAGTIFSSGVMPMGALGLMADAAPRERTYRVRRITRAQARNPSLPRRGKWKTVRARSKRHAAALL